MTIILAIVYSGKGGMRTGKSQASITGVIAWKAGDNRLQNGYFLLD